MSIVLTTIIWGLIGAATAYMANTRGRDPYLWFALGIVLGIFAMLILLVLPQVESQENKDASKEIEIQPLREEVPFMGPAGVALHEWFYIDKTGQQYGPVRVEEIKKLWMNGELDELSFVWSDGMEKWVRAVEIPGFTAEMKNP